jgi:hypothetical protein
MDTAIAGSVEPQKDRRVEDERLSRMEVKIDALADAMKDIVIVQRDMHHVLDRLGRGEQRMDKIEDKLNRVVASESSSSTSSATFERIALFIFSALIGILGTLIFDGGGPV